MGKLIPPLAPASATIYDAGAIVYDSVSGKLKLGDGTTSNGKALALAEENHVHSNKSVLDNITSAHLTQIAKVAALETEMGNVSSALTAILGTQDA